ncbi:MAG: exodeoxyribonuclease VII large subunit, partial [Alphaproteobacteria bacterium]|nr:exodeoxyribonuclease VII large subunit [Alphaproteobacteria bacterium]
VHVLLYPATVQGVTAAGEVAAGIEYFNRMQNVDVIIVARGGGSLEDLLPFSEEVVVRAAAASKIPLISGVGHEPDWMLIDFAADYRAPTPTGAAEAVVPTKISLIQDLENLWVRLSGNFTTRLINAKQRLESVSIKSPKQVLMEHAQRLDDVGRTLNLIVGTKIVSAQQKLDVISTFPNILQNRMMVLNQLLAHAGQMLNSLSYKNVLARGYAIVRDANNKIISRADAGTPASIEFTDGVIQL